MSNPSPACTVNGSPTPVDVGASTSFTIALGNPAGADFWSVLCTSTDGTSTATAINASLVINQTTKTATCTSDVTGTALIFTSTVGVRGFGLDANFVRQAAFTTTFKVNVPTTAGARVVAALETFEQDPAVGYASELNAAIRTGGGGASFPPATEQTVFTKHAGSVVAKGGQLVLNLLSFGGVADGVTDDTAAWKALIATISTAASTVIVHVPNTGHASVVTDTLRFWPSVANPYNGTAIRGEGGFNQGIDGQTSSLKWAGVQIRGASAVTGTKHTNAIQLTGLSGLQTAQVGGGVPAMPGDIIEWWGDVVNPTNNGRFPIVRIDSDSVCWVSNPLGVSGSTGGHWLLERCMLDLRISGVHISHIAFFVLGNTYCAAGVNWTANPLTGAPPTAPTFDHVGWFSDNVIVSGKYPLMRWGLKIADWFVPQPGHPNYLVDADGFNAAQNPSNCDLGFVNDSIFQSMEQGGMFYAAIADTNDYAWSAWKTEFVATMLGAYSVSAGPTRNFSISVGQCNFYESGGGAIYDFVVSFPASTLRTTFAGGHSEGCGGLIRTVDPNIHDHTTFMDGNVNFGWASVFGQMLPSGLSPTGYVVEGSRTICVENNYWEPGGGSVPMLIHALGTGGQEQKVIKRGNVWGVSPFQKGTGNGIRPFTLTTNVRGPFTLFDGATLTYTITNGLTGVTSGTKTVTFHAANCRDIARVWPWEIAGMWRLDANAAGVETWFNGDASAIIFLHWLNPYNPHSGDAITFTGGTAAAALGVLTANVDSVPSVAPDVVGLSNGTLYGVAPMLMVASGERGFDKLSIGNDYTIVDAEYHQFDPSVPPNGLGPQAQNLTPGPSMTKDVCSNLGDTFTFPSSGTIAVVIFQNQERNPDYEISLTGLSPYAIVHKTSRGFTINATGGAPGATPVTWQMFRGASGTDPLVFPPTGGLATPIIWVDPQFGVSTLGNEASSVALTNSPDDLRPRIHTLVERKNSLTFTTSAGKNDMFCIDRNDQPPTADQQPNGWPYIYQAFETNPGALDAGAGTILTTDAYTLVLVTGIPGPVNAVHSNTVYCCNFNGLGLVYNVSAFGTRSLAYFGVGTFPDTVADAMNGGWELVEISKTSGSAPVLKVNGVTRTMTGAPTTFTPTTARTIAIDGDSGVKVAFAAIWATDVSASMAPLRSQLNTRFKLF